MTVWPRVAWVATLAGLWVAAVLGTSASGRERAAAGLSPQPREVTVVARQYGYEPNRLVVDKGETVRFKLVSRDTVHGFFIEGYDVDAIVLPGRLPFELRRPSRNEPFRSVEEIVVRFDRPGKFHFRCSMPCGPLHPFMQGELIVRPNVPFAGGLWGVLLLGIGFVGWTFLPAAAAAPPKRRIDLLQRVPGLRWLVTRRWFQFAIVLPNFLVLVFFIAAGLFGTPIGNRNIIITIVWILWWFLLIALLVPFGGRAWCLACPIPAVGEWLARRRFIGVQPRGAGAGPKRRRTLRWPAWLKGIWLQNFLFLAMCSVSIILVTRPALTAAVLALMVAGAVAVHLLFERRTFCRYVCPLNGWMSLYSMAAMTEVRPRDPHTCSTCSQRTCVTGTASAWACPWLALAPFRLKRNNYCGVCMECVKACSNANMTLLARPFCGDRVVRRLDEAWIAFIMIALAIAYSVTLLGPWATVRDWANVTAVGNWPGFAVHSAAVWATALLLIPGLWYAASWISAKWLVAGGEVGTRQLFLRYSFMLVPLGLMAWVAFSLPLILVNYTHITSSLSDPMGAGWDLFGTAMQQWRPLFPEYIAYLQVAALLAGLAAALWSGGSVARQLCGNGTRAVLSLLPHALLCAGFTLVLMRLYAG